MDLNCNEMQLLKIFPWSEFDKFMEGHKQELGSKVVTQELTDAELDLQEIELDEADQEVMAISMMMVVVMMTTTMMMMIMMMMMMMMMRMMRMMMMMTMKMTTRMKMITRIMMMTMMMMTMKTMMMMMTRWQG
jgi:hypothetical protein